MRFIPSIEAPHGPPTNPKILYKSRERIAFSVDDPEIIGAYNVTYQVKYKRKGMDNWYSSYMITSERILPGSQSFIIKFLGKFLLFWNKVWIRRISVPNFLLPNSDRSLYMNSTNTEHFNEWQALHTWFTEADTAYVIEVRAISAIGKGDPLFINARTTAREAWGKVILHNSSHAWDQAINLPHSVM